MWNPLQYLIHLALTNVPHFWWVITFLFCSGTGFIVAFVGSVRWWNIKYTNLPRRWARHRRELNRIIGEQAATIEQQAEEIHFYKNRANVVAVVKLQNDAERKGI
jgi:uncharacterized membrane protein YccC